LEDHPCDADGDLRFGMMLTYWLRPPPPKFYVTYSIIKTYT
jgi:hypothetical protein